MSILNYSYLLVNFSGIFRPANHEVELQFYLSFENVKQV